MESYIFWDMKQFSPLKVSPTSQRKATYFMLVSCLAYTQTLKKEVTCFSETSVNFYLTTRHYITEKGILRNHCLREPEILLISKMYQTLLKYIIDK